MWVLECDGDILEHKRVWLRPGKKYLFGRTKLERGRLAGFTIENKSVSRKHMTLSVSSLKCNDASVVDSRSELSLEDEKTKIGTEIDGERIKGGKRTLKADEHIFKLGSYEHAFRIKWRPVVLSFTFPSKETKGGKDPLIPMRGRVEDLDIKVILPYLSEKTTHVVSNKRNTAKCLQALINGKFIVDSSFIDALVFATTPGDLDEPESLSPLEEDFDANWPDALDHLPPASKEPNPRPATFFAPTSNRKDVFEGYTFVFADQTQFETLQAPITSGGGKAIRFNITMGKTSVEDIVRFVKETAGEKGLGEFEDGSEGKGVVFVKFQGAKGYESWAVALQDEVALTLDHRLIQQSEFLDAILTNDASKLRRPLPEDNTNGIITPTATAVDGPRTRAPEHTAGNGTVPSQPAQSQHVARRRPRGTVVSMFKGFEDDYDASTISTQKRKQDIGFQKFEGLVDSVVEDDSDDHQASSSRVRQSSKRPRPEEDDEDVINQMLPAQAAVKRRRIEEEREAAAKGVPLESISGKPAGKEAEPARKIRPRKEVNIHEVVRERRKAEEEAGRRDEESLQETLDGMTVEEMKNLAVVEEMDVPERTGLTGRSESNGIHDARWDERWNGRKNFKKFRRRGEADYAPRRTGPGVIVPLEEVKKKDFGIGDEYWLDSSKSSKKKSQKEKEREEQQTSLESQALEPDNQPFTTARSQQPDGSMMETPSELVVNGENVEIVDVDAPRMTRLRDKTAAVHQNSNQSQVPLTKGKGKRFANGSAGDASAPKKQKTFTVSRSDSDSEDELKFRFKKRR